MIYPNFAFYPSTKLLLFFINCFIKTFNYYLGANLILKMYQKDYSMRRKILFSFASAMLLDILVVYSVSYLNGYINNLTTPHFGGFSRSVIGSLYNFLVILNPLSYLILYVMGIKILRLSKYESINTMRLSYTYFICCSLFYCLGSHLIFPYSPDIRGWNFLRDIYILVFSTFGIFLLYKVACIFINKSKIYVDYSHHIFFKSSKIMFMINLTICFAIYIVTVALLFYPKLDGIHVVLYFISLFMSIIIKVYFDYTKIYRVKISNKDEHIISLNKAIKEFNGIRHDFNNILQTYSGYLVVGDYEKLKLYHQKTINMTISAETNLDIISRMAENPSFFSLMANKLDKAKEHFVTFQVALLCNMKDNYMDELDFNRIMSALLDNAIEAAEETVFKRVNLNCQLKSDNSKLIILSNDTIEDINTDKIFTLGYTTKLGHKGHGLVQLHNVLGKYGNITFSVSAYKGSFTVYFELKPINYYAESINNKLKLN